VREGLLGPVEETLQKGLGRGFGDVELPSCDVGSDRLGVGGNQRLLGSLNVVEVH
jgi:hypothetical protein